MIPIVVSMTKKKKMNPFGGALGCTFQNILISDNRFEATFGCLVMVLDLMSDVTPSSKDEPPLVLFMLGG
jgi:hypothetical protein